MNSLKNVHLSVIFLSVSFLFKGCADGNEAPGPIRNDGDASHSVVDAAYLETGMAIDATKDARFVPNFTALSDARFVFQPDRRVDHPRIGGPSRFIPESSYRPLLGGRPVFIEFYSGLGRLRMWNLVPGVVVDSAAAPVTENQDSLSFYSVSPVSRGFRLELRQDNIGFWADLREIGGSIIFSERGYLTSATGADAWAYSPDAGWPGSTTDAGVRD